MTMDDVMDEMESTELAQCVEVDGRHVVAPEGLRRAIAANALERERLDRELLAWKVAMRARC